MKTNPESDRPEIMKSNMALKMFVLFFLFVTFTRLILAQDANEQGFNLVSIEEFIVQMKMNENIALLDVRTWMEYKKGRIPDALFAGTSQIMDSYTDTMDFDKPLFLYCAANFRSKPAGRSLVAKGFKNIYILEPGFYGWRAADKEIDKSRPSRIPSKMKK